MKFTIRDLFLVTMIVALITGLVLDRQQLAKLSKKLDTLAEENRNLRMAELQLIKAGIPLPLPTSQAPAPSPPKK